MEPEHDYPILCTGGLSERETEVVAVVLEDRLRSLFTFVLRADDETWTDLVAEFRAEQLPGEGIIRSRLGMMNVLRRSVGASPFVLEDLDFLRRVGE